MGRAGARGGSPIEAQVAKAGHAIERLFVALPVPAEIARSLAALQPRARSGVRLSRIDDLHLTLHFLGNGQVGPVRQILRDVRGRPFAVRLNELGTFGLRGGRRVLWVGAEPSAPLGDLHEQVGAVLQRLGFEPEQRPYVPHITLARLAPGADPEIGSRFAERSVPAAASGFDCEEFALYVSESARDGPRYRIVERYAL